MRAEDAPGAQDPVWTIDHPNRILHALTFQNADSAGDVDFPARRSSHG